MTAAVSKLAQVASATKLCHGCKRPLPLDAFARNWKAADGLQNLCKDRCMVAKIAAGREAARAKREAEREQQPRQLPLTALARVPDPVKPPTVTRTTVDLRPLLGRIQTSAQHARGMAMLDPRLEDHANDLEMIHLDLVEALDGLATK